MPHALFAELPGSPLVSTEWLADRLGSAGLVVLDASVAATPAENGNWAYSSGREAYLADGHVPGAVFADLFDEFSDPDGAFGFARPDAERFAREARAHGIDDASAVVIYDRGNGIWAARLWWLFRSVGFDARVLDGGFVKWRAEGRPSETGDVRPGDAGAFSITGEGIGWASKADVEAVVAGNAKGLLVCAVPTKEYVGETGVRTRLGHIPGSVSIPASRLIDRTSNTYLPIDELRAVFGEVAASPDPIISYCAAGIAAAGDALALTLLGRDDVLIYDGSLNEWESDAESPIEAGAAA